MSLSATGGGGAGDVAARSRGRSRLAIETKGLYRRFGRVKALSGIDLRVPERCVYGFLGPNGAGKTTTIRLLLGLLRANSGEAWVGGYSPWWQRRRALSQVGALVEQPSLYSHLTGRENLEVTRRLLNAEPARIHACLEMVRLTADADRRVSAYSQGMRQRLGLALALMPAPPILILDEPTNGLDPAGIREMRALIRRLPKEEGVTVFLSSHLLSEVEQVADQIGIIHHGRMLFQGELAELQAQVSDHVEVWVDRPPEALVVLQQAGWRVQPDDNDRLHVAGYGATDAAVINAHLVQAGLRVMELNVRRPSLEDLFLHLTQDAVA